MYACSGVMSGFLYGTDEMARLATSISSSMISNTGNYKTKYQIQ
jgi:hypothetical protein